jgi:sirohydrochlorin cobaltochelatase
MLTIRIVWLSVVAVLFAIPSFAETGILLLAHGGTAEWNTRVVELARTIDRTTPVEIAFGMATRGNIQAAVDRLAARRVTEIVAVPLFISSWSSVVTSTEYLLGLRAQTPPELALFAKMDHRDPVASPAGPSHAGHDAMTAGLDATPVVSDVPIRGTTPALNAHPFVAEILTTRARSISRNPAEEAVVIVAHGPSSDEENSRWLQDMGALAGGVARAEAFASVDYLTV